MRSISAQLAAAAANPKGYSPLSSLRVNKGRFVITAFDDQSNGFAPLDPAGINANPLPEAIIYSDTAADLITIITKANGQMVAMNSGDGTQRVVKEGVTALQGVAGCKAGLIDGYLFYLASDGNIKRATLDMANLLTQEDMVTAQANIDTWTGAGGSLHAISSTQVAAILVDEGGARFKYYEDSGGWNEYASPGRLFSPENVFDTPQDVVFSTSVAFDGKIWFYITDVYRGNIWATAIDLDNYEWRDIHEAVQSDLSDARIANAFVSNGLIHLCIQFERLEEWDTGYTYTLVLHSHSGHFFSMDRFTFISRLGHRLQLVQQDDSILWAASLNRVAQQANIVPFSDSDPDGTDIPGTDIIRIENQNNDDTNIVLADRDDVYRNNPHIAKGSQIVLNIGYRTTAGAERVAYSVLRILSVQKNHLDNKAPLVIRAAAECSFFIRDLSSPYYGEIVGRTSEYDPCADLSNLYIAPKSGVGMTEFTADFWNSKPFDNNEDVTVTGINIINGGGPDYTTGAASHKLGFRTQELRFNRDLNGHPEVAAGGDFQVSLYGWCATTGSGTPTDSVECYANIIDGETGIESLVQGSLTSTYDKFPKNYNGTAAGSYPITWDIPADEGDQIAWLGFIFIQTTGETTFLVESVHLSNITAIDSRSATNTPWSQVESEVVGEIISELEVPDIGAPFVMFSSQPYNPFNFQVYGDFYVSGTGGGDGTTELGLVGLAEDATNMVFCRLIVQTNTWEIVKLRNGAETVLASTVQNLGSDVRIFFEHRDGEFAIYVNTTNSFADPLLTYSWQEADGAIATHEINWHVGIRAGVIPLSFLIAGFDFSDGEGIPLAGNEDVTDFQNMASSGKIKLDETVYRYTGKTNSERPVGPYQGRSTFDWSKAAPYDNGNGTFTGIAVDMRWYAPEKTRYSKQNYFLASENGHTWIIDETEFDPWTRTGGSIVQLRNRSRHFCDAAHSNLIGSANRVCISPGLTGITLFEGESGLHSYNARAYSFIDNTIRVRTFRASDGLHDATVKDMIAQVIEVAGSKAGFPGDLTWDSLAFTANVEQQLYP